MKKVCILLLMAMPFALQFCAHSKKAMAAKVPPKITYMANVQPLMMTNCTPCHFPPKGNKKPYDTYSSVQGGIDEIIERIQKNPGERGFMPFKHAKLSDSTIMVYVQWKKDGLLEK